MLTKTLQKCPISMFCLVIGLDFFQYHNPSSHARGTNLELRTAIPTPHTFDSLTT